MSQIENQNKDIIKSIDNIIKKHCKNMIYIIQYHKKCVRICNSYSSPDFECMKKCDAEIYEFIEIMFKQYRLRPIYIIEKI